MRSAHYGEVCDFFGPYRGPPGSIDRKTGARGLRSIMESILLDTMFDLPSLEGVEEVLISQQAVEGTARPLYSYAARAGGSRVT